MPRPTPRPSFVCTRSIWRRSASLSRATRATGRINGTQATPRFPVRGRFSSGDRLPPDGERHVRGVRIVDTFAEAFDMRAARVVITAQSSRWARTAAQSMTGFATSVIGCKVEAGIETDLLPEDTPDGRPGVSVLLFAFDAAGLGQRLVDRVGQSVLTCPTTACFDGLPDASERVIVGGLLRQFAHRYPLSKFLYR